MTVHSNFVSIIFNCQFFVFIKWDSNYLFECFLFLSIGEILHYRVLQSFLNSHSFFWIPIETLSNEINEIWSSIWKKSSKAASSMRSNVPSGRWICKVLMWNWITKKRMKDEGWRVFVRIFKGRIKNVIGFELLNFGPWT